MSHAEGGLEAAETERGGARSPDVALPERRDGAHQRHKVAERASLTRERKVVLEKRLLPPVSERLAMSSISHVAAGRVKLALCHSVPGMGFQEH